VAQRAAIVALNDCQEEILEMKETYARRRRFMIDRLREIGFEISKEPEGAFYVFANAKRFSNDSYKLAFDILENAHVGVTPGIDFGPHGEGYIRFSYANSIENIEKGLDRLAAFLERLQFKSI
jgi:aspartate/methionine/tyrosine aminotransferase